MIHSPSILLRLALAAALLGVPASSLNAASASTARKSAESRWEQAIISIEVTRKVYDYLQPWAKRSRNFIKTGVVVAPGEILTAAEDLPDRTLVRVQKQGRGKFWEAEVSWIDYHANLAMLTVKDPLFWPGLKAVDLVAGAPNRDDLQLARWRNGNLEFRKVDFSQYFVDDARLSPVPALFIEFDTDMTSIGNSAPLISGGKLAGITCMQVDNHVRAIPATFIRGVLDARKKGQFRGLGFLPFFWQPTENPATHAFLKLPGEPRGVAVIFVPELPAVAENLKPRDIILQIDGFDIDVRGRYKDPDYGQLMLENLPTRNKFAGDILRIKVWRDGREQVINYQLPKFDYNLRMLPDYAFDQEPEYLIAGGFVFQPLIKPYLRSWGAEWKRTSPFRLSYYDNEFPTADRPSLVVMSLVLPDAYNLGYQELRSLAVEKLNGAKIRNLADVRDALKQPKGGFHTIEFVRSDTVRRVIVDAQTMDAATARVLERYSIPKAANVTN